MSVRFGMLTVLSWRKGAKNVHPTAMCQCDCGKTQVVRKTHLVRGERASCRHCSWANAWVTRPRVTLQQRNAADAFSVYKINAKRKKLMFDLLRDQFIALVTSSCFYCGLTPEGNRVNGVDRMNNLEGYTRDNSVACCSACNYSKRDMSIDQFLSWVNRIGNHQRNQSVLQRMGSVRRSVAS